MSSRKRLEEALLKAVLLLHLSLKLPDKRWLCYSSKLATTDYSPHCSIDYPSRLDLLFLHPDLRRWWRYWRLKWMAPSVCSVISWLVHAFHRTVLATRKWLDSEGSLLQPWVNGMFQCQHERKYLWISTHMLISTVEFLLIECGKS